LSDLFGDILKDIAFIVVNIKLTFLQYFVNVLYLLFTEKYIGNKPASTLGQNFPLKHRGSDFHGIAEEIHLRLDKIQKLKVNGRVSLLFKT
jgi:hypothetical protein